MSSLTIEMLKADTLADHNERTTYGYSNLRVSPEHVVMYESLSTARLSLTRTMLDQGGFGTCCTYEDRSYIMLSFGVSES